MVVPIRACLENVPVLKLGDYYIGRGSRERGLSKSLFCNDYKVAVYTRPVAVAKFAEKLQTDERLRAALWTWFEVGLPLQPGTAMSCRSDHRSLPLSVPLLLRQRRRQSGTSILKCIELPRKTEGGTTVGRRFVCRRRSGEQRRRLGRKRTTTRGRCWVHSPRIVRRPNVGITRQVGSREPPLPHEREVGTCFEVPHEMCTERRNLELADGAGSG